MKNHSQNGSKQMHGQHMIIATGFLGHSVFFLGGGGGGLTLHILVYTIVINRYDFAN